jgi:NDP-sugar pyrophosphorylase family protein
MKNNTRIVLTMAGKYERFRLFGNKVPKYLMPLGKTTVLWHIIYELKQSSPNNEFYLLANYADRDFQPIIASILNDFSIPLENLVYTSDTNSQLHTAFNIFKAFEDFYEFTGPIAFSNIDTIMKNRNDFFSSLKTLDEQSSLIDTFTANSPEYSYILKSEDDQVRDIADHIKLSEMACSGLYGFCSASFFCKYVTNFLQESTDAGFSAFYKSLLKNNMKVHYNNNVDYRDTIVLGTPEEYITNLHKFI